MSDESKKLSEEQKNKFIEWLRSKNIKNACQACGTNSWIIGDRVVSGMTIANGGVHIGGPLYPTVFITCTNCFHTLYFMAVPIGVVEKDQPEDASDG